MIYRASVTQVVCDDFVYKFATEQEADAFERCLQDHSLDQCRIYYRPRQRFHCPVKLKSQLEFIQEAGDRRRERYQTAVKERRQQKFSEHRAMSMLPQDTGEPPTSGVSSGSPPLLTPPVLLPFNLQGAELPSQVPVDRPYEGKYVSYVVHGHGGHLLAMVKDHPQLKYAKVRLYFYCMKGETTQHTERRNKDNAPKKLIESLLTSEASVDRCCETIDPGGSCEPLMLQGDSDPSAWPKQGIWFVARDRPDTAPYECVKIGEVPLQLTPFLRILEVLIKPDGRRRGLRAPLDIYWVACRALIGDGQSAAEAGRLAGL